MPGEATAQTKRLVQEHRTLRGITQAFMEGKGVKSKALCTKLVHSLPSKSIKTAANCL